jgi:hypothetical protein
MSSVVRVAVLVAAMLGVRTGAVVQAQGRPVGDGRIWFELGLAASQQAGRCVTCTPSAIGGASVSAAGGVTLSRGFGVAVLGRAFQQFSFESSLSSRYFMALAQYAPARVPVLTLNAGAGWARHSGDDVSRDPSNGSGAALYAGTALRLPARSTYAITLTADILQSIEGSPSPHPRLFSVGLAIGAATSPLH